MLICAQAQSVWGKSVSVSPLLYADAGGAVTNRKPQTLNIT